MQGAIAHHSQATCRAGNLLISRVNDKQLCGTGPVEHQGIRG